MTGCVPTTRTVSDDSRRVGSGDAYVAIPGRRWHGMDFEDAAPQAGAIVAISDRPGRWLPWMSDGVADGLPVG